MAQVRDLLVQHRLVTLVGPGGAGKTRLATEAARPLTGVLADGVWLAELAPVTDPDELPSTLLGSLGLRETSLIEPTAGAAGRRHRPPDRGARRPRAAAGPRQL